MDRTSQDPHRVSSQQASVDVVRALLGAVLTVLAGAALLALCSWRLAPLRVLGDERHAGWVVGVACALVPALAVGSLVRARLVRGRHRAVRGPDPEDCSPTQENLPR